MGGSRKPHSYFTRFHGKDLKGRDVQGIHKQGSGAVYIMKGPDKRRPKPRLVR